MNSPSDTAGLMWQPDTLPMTNAIATMDRPNASAMPTGPSAAPPIAALPQPNRVSTKVPSVSAAYFLIDDGSMVPLLSLPARTVRASFCETAHRPILPVGKGHVNRVNSKLRRHAGRMGMAVGVSDAAVSARTPWGGFVAVPSEGCGRLGSHGRAHRFGSRAVKPVRAMKVHSAAMARSSWFFLACGAAKGILSLNNFIRNALTRTVGTNPSSESRRMLRAGGGRPERHLRAVRRERCAAHPDDLRRHAGQVAWTGDSVISPIRAWPHRRFGAGRRIAPFLLRSWCRLSAAGFFYARKRGLVERTQGVDLAGRGQGHRPAERGCGHAEGAASWKKGSDTCN